MLQTKTNKCFPIPTNPYEQQMQDETRKHRREIKGKMKHTPKINQLTGDSGFNSQRDYGYEYGGDRSLN